MNLTYHLGLILKHRSIAVGGVLLGVLLAVLAAYSVPSMERRGSETWSSESHVLVTQPGFPEGRVVLPDVVPTPGVAPAPTPGVNEGSGEDRQRYADPARLASLALLYASIASSEQVRSRVSPRPDPTQLQAEAVDATGNGTTFLPIIKVTTQAATAGGAERLNTEAFAAFEKLLESRQKANDISATERVRLTVLDPPAQPLLVSGRSLTPSLLAFVLCCLATLALIHIRENLLQRRAAWPEADDGFRARDGEADNELIELAPLRGDFTGRRSG